MRDQKYLFALITVIWVLFSCNKSSRTEKIVPNDPYFKNQISFANEGGIHILDEYTYRKSPLRIHAYKGISHELPRAWKITTGSKGIIAAILGDGFLYHHTDVKDNVWYNRGESGIDTNGYPKETNGVDDDDNGYIDDVMGWDFVFNDPDPDPYVFMGKDHARIVVYTHSITELGIIGARGNNNIGVAGINWEISLMLLKIGAQGTTGIKRAERASEAIRYAVDNGARVVNWSGFVGLYTPEQLNMLKQAIDYAENRGVLIIVSAGNDKVNIDKEENKKYPACFGNDNIIVVAEVDFDGRLYEVPADDPYYTGGSNFGQVNVDLAAIGQNYTTFMKNTTDSYCLGGGTSDAAPVVTGVAGLIFSIRPDLDGSAVKNIILETVTKVPALHGKIKSEGIVNAYKALLAAQKATRLNARIRLPDIRIEIKDNQ